MTINLRSFVLICIGAVTIQNVFAASATLDKIKSTGTVTMGVRESSIPMSYTTGDSRFDGYHVEVCRMIWADIKDSLKLSTLRINYQPVTSQNRVPLVQNGTVDIECGTTTNNMARAKDVAFANTLYVEEVRIAVKANSGINTIGQLAGKKVATTTGTTSVQLLRKHEKANGVNFDEVFGKDHADSFLLLESGRADAFVMDGSILAGSCSATFCSHPRVCGCCCCPLPLWACSWRVATGWRWCLRLRSLLVGLTSFGAPL